MNITATLFAQIVTFLILIWFVKATLWGPMTKILEDRKSRIADGLNAADRAQRDLELAQKKATEDLKEAKTQAAAIIDQANRRASQIVEEAKAQARSEGERLIEQAQSEIDMEINRAREELRAAVSGLVISGAEKVLGTEVDRQAHEKLLAQMATEL